MQQTETKPDTSVEEDLQAQKLRLEIATLQRPFYQNYTFWLSAVTGVAALVGIVGQSYVSKYENARADYLREKALAELATLTAQKDSTEAEIAGLTKTEQSLRTRIQGLLTSVAQTDAAKQNVAVQSAINLAENALYSVSLYGYGLERAQFDQAVAYLTARGYTLPRAELLTARPRWLSPESAVFYYDERTANLARTLAEELSSRTGQQVKAARGAGLGVPKAQQLHALRIHLVGS